MLILICRALKEEKYASRRAILPMLQMVPLLVGNSVLMSGKMLACINMWKYWISVRLYS
ncbi:hypothetical protein MKX01_037015 [Papaver californicum]|nr:hypothetical protein MKX01_037015 [Papaver californicum]